MRLVPLVLLACSPPEDAVLDVSIRTAGPGIRDLEVQLAGTGRFTWFEDDQPTDLTGRVVPADRLWPGSTWRVEVETDAGAVGTASFTVPEPRLDNVVIVVLDDVGVDKLAAFDGPWAPDTPTLDRLAAEGVRFTRAYASSVCTPTRGSLLTGLHPHRTGLGWIADTGNRMGQLPLSAHTIPEVLQATHAAPYANAALGKWHVAGPQAPDWLAHPNAQGFEHFAGAPGNPEYRPGRGYFAWSKNVDGTLFESTTYMTTDTADDLLTQLDTLPEPFFLYVGFNAPHGPLHRPPDDLVVTPLPDGPLTPLQQYDAMLEALDTEYGRALDGMDPARRQRTVFITLGDNGSMPRAIPPEHYVDRFKHTPYEGGVRVPLLVNGPVVDAPGTVSDALVHVVDLLPTVAELAGVPLVGPEGDHVLLPDGDLQPLDGRSLLPVLTGDDARRFLYTEAFHPNGGGNPNGHQRMVRSATHKLVRWGPIEEFYRLDGPFELDDTPLGRRDMDRDDREAWEALQYALDDYEDRLIPSADPDDIAP